MADERTEQIRSAVRTGYFAGSSPPPSPLSDLAYLLERLDKTPDVWVCGQGHQVAIERGTPSYELPDCPWCEVNRLNSWAGLMSVLDEHYPVGVFDGSSSDPGDRIVVVEGTRESRGLAAAAAERAAALEEEVGRLRALVKEGDKLLWRYSLDEEQPTTYRPPLVQQFRRKARAALAREDGDA